MVNPSGSRGSNRMSMYRKPKQMSMNELSKTRVEKNKVKNKRSMTIYNPFSFTKEVMDARNSKQVREVSQSLEGPLDPNQSFA